MFRLKMEHPDVEVVSGGAKDGEKDKYAKKFELEFKIPYSEFPPQHEPHNMRLCNGSLQLWKTIWCGILSQKE